MHECPRCQYDRVIKNGSAKGKPKKQCKACGDQFTRTTPRGQPCTTQTNAVLLYLRGISMNRIAFLLRVSAQAVLHCLRAFAIAHYEKRSPPVAQWDVKVYCTDKWATYASVIPQDKLVQSTATTHDMERHHCRQRHWFGRFKRQSIMVSKSREMVDLTMALFARFWVNGNQDELISLLG